jgi:hypothetical protein
VSTCGNHEVNNLAGTHIACRHCQGPYNPLTARPRFIDRTVLSFSSFHGHQSALCEPRDGVCVDFWCVLPFAANNSLRRTRRIGHSDHRSYPVIEYDRCIRAYCLGRDTPGRQQALQNPQSVAGETDRSPWRPWEQLRDSKTVPQWLLTTAICTTRQVHPRPAGSLLAVGDGTSLHLAPLPLSDITPTPPFPRAGMS